MSYSEEEWIAIVDKLHAERDRYKAQAEKYRVALTDIRNLGFFNPDDIAESVYAVAKHALEGDEE